jgi:hypothetical protein
VALYIYRVGRSCPARKYFDKPKSIRTPRFGSDTGAPVRPVRHTGQTDVLDVLILYKPHLSHPDSDLDVPHMNLDLLDETYPMVKSKLYLVVFDHTGLTGGTHRFDRSDKTCQFWVRTVMLVDATRIYIDNNVDLECHHRPRHLADTLAQSR